MVVGHDTRGKGKKRKCWSQSREMVYFFVNNAWRFRFHRNPTRILLFKGIIREWFSYYMSHPFNYIFLVLLLLLPAAAAELLLPVLFLDSSCYHWLDGTIFLIGHIVRSWEMMRASHYLIKCIQLASCHHCQLRKREEEVSYMCASKSRVSFYVFISSAS